jgi:hypothetical protein
MAFKSLEESSSLQNIDENLFYYDWAKNDKLKLLHTALITLGDFTKENQSLPLSWNQEDANKFVELVKKRRTEIDEAQEKYLKLFSYTCSGTFGSLCAFYGGLAAQ